MAVYYKFKSAKDYDSIPIEGQFISVANLKERIFESKHLGRGTDFDLMVSNAQTDEEYVDEAGMIPKNTSVLIRRVPGRPRKPIVTERAELKIVEEKVEDILPSSSMVAGDSSAMKYPEEFEWDEFGNDLYSIPEVHHHAQPIVPIVDVTPADKADEDSKIRALVDTPALDWNRQGHDSYGAGRGFGRGMGGRMMAGRGFGRVGLEKKTPPAGYICHRCKIAGHFIQHCPTNGDPNYDIRRVKPPTGIPRSMLMANPDGSYALPSGAVAVLKPNEAAFEREIEGLPSTRSISDLPPELHCPLCKEVMKDAVLTSKCCFKSFCDKCIRNYIISNSKCVCGAMNVLADDLLPNKTLRDTISRILETTTSSTENAGSLAHVQDTESARYGQPRVPSPTLSNASKCEPKLLPPAPTAEAAAKQPSPDIKECEAFTEAKADYNVPTQLFDKKLDKTMDSARTTPDSTNARDAANTEENLEKLPPGEQGKKKKKKKTRIAAAGADMQWRGFQDFGVENFAGMPVGPSAYNPYWSNGMPIGIEGFMPSIAAPMPYIGYAPSPFDVAFGGMIPHDPFAVAQGYMIPGFPQRDLAELGMNGFGMNQQGPLVSREEFDSRKAEMRRKREMDRAERLCERDQKPREREKVASGKDSAVGVGTFDAPPPALNKPRLRSEAANVDRLDREPEDRPDRSANTDRHGVSKRRSSDRERESDGAERKQKGSVFSRISFPADGGKRKKSSPSDPANGRRNCESSDDERHFKRRSSSRREEERDEEGASSSRLSRASREPKRRL